MQGGHETYRGAKKGTGGTEKHIGGWGWLNANIIKLTQFGGVGETHRHTDRGRGGVYIMNITSSFMKIASL